MNRKVWHKGGPARAVLGVIADSPVSMQESEFPWNDFDAMVANKMINKKAALKIGVDADGIEYMGEDELNFPRYCAGRDTTQNQVCLGSEGIYFSDEALFTAVSGHTRAENEYVSNKAIYGFDTVIVEGVVLAKPRALMRLVKALVEGKALSFDYLPLNACLDFGTNTLFLAKRWSKKENFSENLQKMFYLLTMMDQTRADEKNVLDTLERVHTEYPFFDFNSEVRLPIEVLRWKSRKLIKQMDREMGWRFHIPTGLEVQRSHGDTIAKFISLDGFILTENNSITEERWSGFLKRCEQRTYEYRKEGLTAYEKIFTKSSLDEETPKFYEGDH